MGKRPADCEAGIISEDDYRLRNLRGFVLWHKDIIAVYDTQEYNELSFAFRR